MQELQFVGLPEDCSGYGKADAKIKLHICARETDGTSQGVTVPGTAPFTVHLFLNDNPNALPGYEPYRIIEGIGLCEDFENLNQNPDNGPVCEYNCVIENLPAGAYSGRIFDSQIEDPEAGVYQGEARFNATNFIAVQPPKVTLGFEVNPGGLETQVNVEIGETPDYGTTIEAGMMNGHNTTPVTIDLAAAKEGESGPAELLLPGKIYHWKAVAANEAGTAETPDQVFQTPDYATSPAIFNPRVISMV